MHLRNFEGAPRTPLSSRPGRELTQQSASERQNPLSSASSAPSRGAFFDMMMTAAPAPPAAPAVSAPRASSAVRVLSSDENSSVRGGSHTAPPAPVRNVPGTGRSIPLEATDNGQGPPPTPPPTPVESLNAFLTKLGYDPASFNARVTSANISVPGISYEYPLLEVTVQGERVGFHLPSAARDLRMTAANISSMLGRPVMDLSVFA